MWFADAPPPTNTIGGPNSPLQYRADPDDGAHVWAISEIRGAWQQDEYPEEFEIMPDVLAGDAAYRLVEIGCVTLPEELTSVAARGPDGLNVGTHPLAPSLLRIGGDSVLAMRRTFGQLDFHVALLADHWILALCPTRARVTLA